MIYTVENGAGVYASSPERVVKVLREWLENPANMKQAAQASKKLARPEAAGRIADILAEHLVGK